MEDVNQQSAGTHQPLSTPCLCAVLRQASRAVTRIYDAEFRGTGLRITQFSLLSLLSRSGEVRQGDLGAMASIDETTLTRSLRLLEKEGWITIRAGADRREKQVAITEAGTRKVEQVRPAWSKAQERMRNALPAKQQELDRRNERFVSRFQPVLTNCPGDSIPPFAGFILRLPAAGRKEPLRTGGAILHSRSS